MRAEAFENKEAGLASAHGGRVVAGGRVVEVARVRITEAGLRALPESATRDGRQHKAGVPRDNQGERRATIRMRMRRG